MGGDGELPHSVVRGIGDKLYEKRKCAALEVEQLVKSLAPAGNTKRVGQIIDKLIEDFAFSPQANYRKGGLQRSDWPTKTRNFCNGLYPRC